MKKTIEKFGIPILMAFIVLIYILNNISIKGYTFNTILDYLIISLNFIAWIMSIIRTIKEKKKSKIIPCIILTVLAIMHDYIFVFSNSNVDLVEQIGLAIFMYEIIDLFKIRFTKNIVNILSVIISIAIIITFLLSQLFTIEKYKKSFINIYDFITSPELTYEKLSDDFEELILEYQNFNDILNKHENKTFETIAYSYKHSYVFNINDFKNHIGTIGIKNQRTLKQYRQALNVTIEMYMNSMNMLFDDYNKYIYDALFIASLEIIMVISLGILNNKKNNIQI